MVCIRILNTDADPTDIALVPNASTGTSTVVQRMIKTFQPGDSILTLSTTYGESLSPSP